MKHLHRVAEENLRVEFAGAVSGDQIVQVESQWRVTDAGAVPVARWQCGIAPALIRGDLIHEEVDPAGLGLPRDQDPVGWQRRHGYLAHHTRELVIDHAVVEQILEHGGHGRDGQRVAHARLFPAR